MLNVGGCIMFHGESQFNADDRGGVVAEVLIMIKNIWDVIVLELGK